jgi:putative GTP pyrophosphokinase
MALDPEAAEATDRTSLLVRYEDLRERYGRLGTEFEVALVNLLYEQGISHFSVTHRIKQFDSFYDKVARKGYGRPFDQTEDLCGLRVICFFSSDVRRVCAAIKREFRVMEADDKALRLGVDQFGYRSYHFVVCIREAWEVSPIYRGLSNLKAEVQVRSILMHAWAEIEHAMVYKNPRKVSEDTRRELSALSAQFEQADRTLDDLRVKIQRSSRFDRDAELDGGLLNELLAFHFPTRCYDQGAADRLLQELRTETVSAAEVLNLLRNTPQWLLDNFEADLTERGCRPAAGLREEALSLILVLHDRFSLATVDRIRHCNPSSPYTREPACDGVVDFWRVQMDKGSWDTDENWWQ